MATAMAGLADRAGVSADYFYFGLSPIRHTLSLLVIFQVLIVYIYLL